MVVPTPMLDAWEAKEVGGQKKRNPSFIELNTMNYTEEDLVEGIMGDDKEIEAEKESTPVGLFMVQAKLAWTRFHENTSAHGVPRIGLSRGAARTMFWLITLIVMIALVLQMSWSLYMKYIQYEVTINTKVVSDRKLVFPAVTICNMNAIKLDALRRYEKVSQLVYPSGLAQLPDGVPQNNDAPGVATNTEVKQRVVRSAPKSTKTKTTSENTNFLQPTTPASMPTSQLNVPTEIPPTSQPPQQSATEVTKGEPSPERSTVTGLDTPTAGSMPSDQTNTSTETPLVIPPKSTEVKTEPVMKISTTRQTPTATNQVTSPMQQSSNTSPQGNVTQEDKLETTLKEKIFEVMAPYPVDIRRALGFDVEEMVVQCTYAGTSCNISTDFIHTYNENYGNCYSLNWDAATPFMSSQSGPEYGLQLLLNVRQDQYTRGLVEGIGMRVVLHSQNRMPFPNNEGILIPTGQLTYVGIKKKEMRRLGGNYGNCVPEGQSDPARNIYEELYGAGYTINGCLATCFQQHVMGECGCANPALPIPNAAFNTTLTICSYGEKDSCFREKLKAFYNSEIHCDCPLPCNEVMYEQTVSAVPWPAMIHDDDLKDVLREALEVSEYIRIFPQSSTSLITENLMKLVIYYDEFLVQKSTEEPAYGSTEILPDIGGILGLYAGVSVITVLEFGELLFDICLAFIHALYRPLRKHVE